MRKSAVLLLLLFAVSASAQSIDARLAASKVPAVGIGIARDGKLREVRVYGELQKGSPAPYDAVFNVASLTKPVVTMLTLKLVAAGRWDLDKPLAKFWVDPDVADDPRAQKLTTRHVLSHQTGFPNWRDKKLAFQADPGTKFGYSGEGFEYLRRALEAKFGKTLPELAKQEIFDPLGMRDTRFVWDDSLESRFARWHDKNGANVYTKYKTMRANAADNLLTTVEDYGRFGAWILAGAGLPQALFEEMVKPQAAMGGKGAMTLGWELQPGFSNGEYALIHSGSDEGVKTLIILLPKSKQGLIVFTNGDNGFDVIGDVVLESLPLGKEIMERAQ
ncbi:MAG: beta-lactamase family protein [Acidobacteria bacterium]|nr:beta-lactamase family protein [Acidobacteriota bacterium]